MASQVISQGTTSKLIEVMMRSSTTGMGLTSLAYGSVTLDYVREGAASADNHVACVSMTQGTWASKGWAEIDSTNMPGLYQLGIPDAALAASALAVTITLRATGAIDKSIRILLSDPVRGLASPTSLPATGTLAVKPAVTLAAADVTGNVPSDVQTIKTNPVVNAGTITFPTTATLASTTNGNWNTAAPLTAQQTRDAMRLAAVATAAKGGIPDTDGANGVILQGFGGAPVQCDLISTPNATAISAFKSGITGVGVYLTGIMATALSETSGYLAAAFQHFFNVAAPTATAASVDQTGNTYALAFGTHGFATLDTHIGDLTTIVGNIGELVDNIPNTVPTAAANATAAAAAILADPSHPIVADGTGNVIPTATPPAGYGGSVSDDQVAAIGVAVAADVAVSLERSGGVLANVEAKTNLITDGSIIAIKSYVAKGGSITLFRGATYAQSLGNALTASDSGMTWPVLSGEGTAIELRLIEMFGNNLAEVSTLTAAGIVVATRSVVVELNETDTMLLKAGPARYAGQLWAVFAVGSEPLLEWSVTVEEGGK